MDNDRIARIKAVFEQLAAAPQNDEQRWRHCEDVLRAHAELFDEEIVMLWIDEGEKFTQTESIGLIEQYGTEEASRLIALELAERSFETAAHAAHVRGFEEIEMQAAWNLANVAEQRGRPIAAADGYEVVRRISKSRGEQRNYLLATFGVARALHVHGGLDRQVIPLLEEAVQLAKTVGIDNVQLRAGNLLMALYESRNDAAGMSRTRQMFKEFMASDLPE